LTKSRIARKAYQRRGKTELFCPTENWVNRTGGDVRCGGGGGGGRVGGWGEKRVKGAGIISFLREKGGDDE